jgi:hypothetical protein
MEKFTLPKVPALPAVEQAERLQMSMQASTETLVALLRVENQQKLALQERVRELESLSGLPVTQSATEHAGMHLYRTEREPFEAIISGLWQDKQDHHQLLSGIMSKNNMPAHVTQRDATVAATVVQWLMSEGGLSFLRELDESSKGFLTKALKPL